MLYAKPDAELYVSSGRSPSFLLAFTSSRVIRSAGHIPSYAACMTLGLVAPSCLWSKTALTHNGMLFFMGVADMARHAVRPLRGEPSLRSPAYAWPCRIWGGWFSRTSCGWSCWDVHHAKICCQEAA